MKVLISFPRFPTTKINNLFTFLHKGIYLGAEWSRPHFQAGVGYPGVIFFSERGKTIMSCSSFLPVIYYGPWKPTSVLTLCPHRCSESMEAAQIGRLDKYKIVKHPRSQGFQCNSFFCRSTRISSKRPLHLPLTFNLLCSDGVNWDIGTPSASVQDLLALQRKVHSSLYCSMLREGY
jgi:hypothetical protein